MVPNFVDEVDCGNFFDQIDDLIEFPPDVDECEGGNLVDSGDCGGNFPSMWNDALPDSDPLLTGGNGNVESDLLSELFGPCDDNVQLEWLSTFLESSFSSGGTTPGKENTFASNGPSQNQFQASSPISVLESSSNNNGHGPHRARTKRPRPTTFGPRLISASFSSMDNLLQAENFAESTPTKKFPKVAREESMKKKNKMTFGRDATESNHEKYPVQEVRRCKHCGITKTPQWRSGPMGPKTLCNACGVRHKSGRLFPEYRPAASPTFVPSLHSNSHKKVLEIRSKVEPMKSEFVPTFSP